MTSAKAFLLFINQTKPIINTATDKTMPKKNQGQSGKRPHSTTLRASSTNMAIGFTRQKIRNGSGTALMG